MKSTQWIMAGMLFAFPAFAGTVGIEPAALTVFKGQTFSVNVNVTAIADLYAFQFDLGFAPGILQATGVITEGSFLPGGGATFFLPGSVDNIAGTVSFTADSLLGPTPGVTGTGTIATVQFTALAYGTSPLNLSNVALLDSTFSDIVAGSTNGSVAVIPEPNGLCLAALGLVAIACARKTL
jgi:hypothetical protein